MRKLGTTILAVLVIIFAGCGLVTTMASGVASAAVPMYLGDQSQSDACSGIDALGNSDQSCGNGQSNINKIVKAVVRILSYIAGITGVIMIIVAGFKYITSNGDSGNITSARTALTYALIGLAIAALAQFLVHFALSNAKT